MFPGSKFTGCPSSHKTARWGGLQLDCKGVYAGAIASLVREGYSLRELSPRQKPQFVVAIAATPQLNGQGSRWWGSRGERIIPLFGLKPLNSIHGQRKNLPRHVRPASKPLLSSMGFSLLPSAPTSPLLFSTTYPFLPGNRAPAARGSMAAAHAKVRSVLEQALPPHVAQTLTALGHDVSL